MILQIFYIVIGLLVCISTIVMTWWFKTNRILNSYLILTSIVLCIYLVLYGAKNLYSTSYEIYNLNYYQVILILTPAVYLFFEKLLQNIKLPEKKDSYFFIIPLLLFNYVGVENKIGNLYNNFYHFGFFIIYLVFYTLYIFRLLNSHIWDENLKNVYSDIVKNWASFIFRMMLAVFFHFSAMMIFQVFQLSRYFTSFFELTFLIIFLVGYFKVIFTPELLYGDVNFKNSISENQNNELSISHVWKLELPTRPIAKKDIYLTPKVTINISQYIIQIEKLAIVDFSFRKRSYSIVEMALELGIPKYYLEYLFKYHCDLSFNDYKRLVRVYDSIQLINEGYLKNNTLNSLAEFVGFSSYNPFLISFKNALGVSPFDYNKNKKITTIILE